MARQKGSNRFGEFKRQMHQVQEQKKKRPVFILSEMLKRYLVILKKQLEGLKWR